VSANLILMCGLPGSGKTTVAKRLQVEHSAVRLCPDEILSNLQLDLWDEQMRTQVELWSTNSAWRRLALGQTVILEYGFWLRSEREEHRRAAKALGADVSLWYLEESLDELLRRVDVRARDEPSTTVAITRRQMEEWITLFQVPDENEAASYDHFHHIDAGTHQEGVPEP
jgi:predicted kinase